MSKQSEAKAAQGYDPNPEPRTCGNCGHFQSDKLLSEWMLRANALAHSRGARQYTLAEDGIEKNKRCGLGEFAVKKSATCNKFSEPVTT